MKKFVSIILSLTMLIVLASCTENTEEKSQTSAQNFMAETLSGKAYKKEKLPTIEGLDVIFAVRNSCYGNLILGSSGSESPAFYMADREFQNAEKITLDNFSIGVNYDVTLCSDGSIIAFVNEQDEESEEYSYWIRKYSSKGELLSEAELTALYEEVPPTKILIDGLYCSDGKNSAVIINGNCYCIDTDGKFLGELTLSDENQEIKEFGTDSKGQLWCTIKVDIDNVKICKVDAERCKIDENGNTYNVGGSIIAPIMPGTNDYTMYLMGRTQIFGIKEDDSIEPVFLITGSDINTNFISSYTFDSDGQLIIPKNDLSSSRIDRYVEIDPAELENIPVVKFGVYDKSPYNEFVEYVNDDQNDYRIEFVEYGNDINENTDLQKDFISGNVPDLLLTDGFDSFSLDDKGVLCDLYDFIDKDDELNRDAFNENLLHLQEKNGCVYALYRNVYINFMYGKTEFVGDNENWSADDYINACENRPDDMYAYQIANTYLDALNFESFIDIEQKKCYFDSDQFLKVCKYAESKSDFMERTTEYDYQFADWEHPTSEELEMQDKIHKELMRVYADDKAMLASGVGYGSFPGFFIDRNEMFNGADVTAVGYITPDGGQPYIDFSNGISISSQSANKEFAWDAVKRFILFQTDWEKGSTSLSILNKRLEEAANNALNPLEGYDGDEGYINHITGEKFKEEFSQEDIDYVMNILNTAKATNIHRLPDQVWDIYLEELEKFKNHECTAEEFADMLQNRISIVIAE